MSSGYKHKAIVITGFWATIVTTLLIGAITSGVATAFNAYSQVEKLKETTAILSNDMKEFKQANFPVQFAEMREQMRGAKEITTRIEDKQNRMDDKLDTLLQNTRARK